MRVEICKNIMGREGRYVFDDNGRLISYKNLKTKYQEWWIYEGENLMKYANTTGVVEEYFKNSNK